MSIAYRTRRYKSSSVSSRSSPFYMGKGSGGSTITSAKRRARTVYSKRKDYIGRTLGFPKMLKFKHKYATQVNVTDSGALAHYQFRANGLYDPDITGTGHQPSWYDNLTAIYDHYTVIGSFIKYTVVPTGTTIQAPFKIITWINDDTSTTGTADALTENKFSKTRVCPANNPSRIVVYNKWSAKSFFGGSILANTELKGTASTDPTEQSVYQLSLRSLDGVSTISVHVLVEITYIAVWKELKEQAVN